MVITRRSFLAALSAVFAATTVPALPAPGQTTSQHVIRCKYLHSLVLLSGDVDLVITDGSLVLIRVGRTTSGMQMLHCDFDGDIHIHARHGGVIAYHGDSRFDDIQMCTSVGLAPAKSVSKLIYDL